MDVEDVSYFLNEIPGCFFRLGTRVEKKGLIYDLHHPKFNIDEESLKIGMGLQLKNILEYLKYLKSVNSKKGGFIYNDIWLCKSIFKGTKP